MTQFFARKLNKKGFTLAELLIVIAIIAVLVAIAIPIFNNSLVRARYAVHNNNGRALKSMAIAELLTSEDFTAKNIKDDDMFIAGGYYDFGDETFKLTGIAMTTGNTTVGTWAYQADNYATTGLTAEKLKTLILAGSVFVQFDNANIKTIGSWGTGKESPQINYVIVFTGIDVQEGIVSLG